MTARLTSAMLVSALIRRVQAEGGFATVLHRGNDAAGAILIECADRGQRQLLMERATGFDGEDVWRENPANPDEATHQNQMEKRRRSDPDLWVIELDIADAKRFAAELFEID